MRTHTMFQDRTAAGRALAGELAPVITRPCVIVAIPRGGVKVALPIVERLRLPLTVSYARKLTAEVAPELAFGALDEDGQAILDEETVRLLELDPADIERAKRRAAVEIQRRVNLYRVPPLARHLPGSGVLLIDDGLATGLTMRAAVAYARRHGAREITVAAPCASSGAAALFRREADRFVSLVVDEDFVAVGAYYDDFAPVPDEEVATMLERARPRVGEDVDVSSQCVTFRNSRGRALTGILLLPASPGPHPVVVVAHGWSSDKDSPRVRTAGEALAAEGFAAFLFDFTGHGESEGTVEECTLEQQVDDLRAAGDVLQTFDTVKADRLGVVGVGTGAAVALRLAAESPKVRALVLHSGSPEGALDAAPRVTVPTLLIVGEREVLLRSAYQDLLGRLTGSRCLEVVPAGDDQLENRETCEQAIGRLTVDWFKKNIG